MSENSGSVAYRENFAALLNDVIQYRERTDNIQSNMEKKITDFGTEMQADDAAVVITPGLLNAVGTGCFQISQRSSAIASMIMSRAQQLFPDEPVTAEIDDPVGFEMQDVPQPRNVSRIISPAAVQTWRQLSDDLIVGKTAVEDTYNGFLSSYLTNRDCLGGGRWPEALHDSITALGETVKGFGDALQNCASQIRSVADYVESLL